MSEVEAPEEVSGGERAPRWLLLVLVVGFVYEWKKGALEWD